MKKVILFFFIISILIFSFNVNGACSEELPILINQVMLGQNEGAKNEFIELYNPNNQNVNLEGYILKKKTLSGTESTLISAKSFIGIIGAQSYFLVSSSEFKDNIRADLSYSSTASLSKDNTIILYNNKKEVSDKLGYGSSSDYFVAPAPTLKNNQILKRTDINIAQPDNSKDFVLKEGEVEIQNSKGDIIKLINIPRNNEIENNDKKTSTQKEKSPILTSLDNINKFKNGDLLIVEGIVTVLPAIFGTQYFYIHANYKNDENIYGLQIYNYNKKFPSLQLGDKIKITGELSVTENGNFKNYKLKTKELNDIEILFSNNILAPAQLKLVSQLHFDQIGQLIKIQGEITQNKTSQIYLDDGQEILIDIKKGTEIPTKSLKEGQTFEITGILNYASNNFKLMPTRNADILNLSSDQAEKPLGEVLNEDFWELKKTKDNRKLLIYLFITIIGAIFYLIFNKKIIK